MRKVRTAIHVLFLLTSSVLLASMWSSFEILELEATRRGEEAHAAAVPTESTQRNPPTGDGRGGKQKDFVRYSQRYQLDPEKRAQMQKQLEEKQQQIITQQRLEAELPPEHARVATSVRRFLPGS
jgi:hypothetical protein